MCLGTIQVLEEVWEDEGARVGRLEDGAVVSLGFVPDAKPGVYVIVHMGVPVEVLRVEDAQAALRLRAGART
jgi:hydrogenase expression/formation protein HypC